MGLYGDRVNPEQTRFQFDKVFTSRYEMDEAVAKGTDRVFQGRFVLVKYDQDFSSVPMYDIVEGYKDNNGNIFADAAKTTRFTFTEFQQVASNDIDNWSTYYYHYMIQNQHFYFKLSHQSEYDQTNIYYTPTIQGEHLIYLHQFIRADDEFYQCTGINNDIPQFVQVQVNNNQLKYLSNYQNDKNHYSNFDVAGYDGTVWQKVYTEGFGRFVIVAYLDSQNPEFQLSADPPTTKPGEVYIDEKNSTNRVYKIKVPNRWGFRVKEATQQNNQYKSDQKEENKALDIYYNFSKLDNNLQPAYSHELKHQKDTSTKNEIIIAPTGKDPNTEYLDKNGNVITNAKDIMELSIHLPAIGNMIDDGYDVIYGYDDNNNRPRDTQWYDAGDIRIRTGDSNLGGKSTDPGTLAGIVNTFQNRLGQIIQTHESYPTAAEILNYEKDYIHEIDGQYYYRDTAYEYDPVNVVAQYTPCNPPLKEYEYKKNRYFIKRNDTYSAATDDFNESETYYIKSVRSTLYADVDLVIYQPNTYYYRSGFDYNLDTAAEPSNIKQQYYSITPSLPKRFPYYDGQDFYTADDDLTEFTRIPTRPRDTEPDLSIPYYYFTIGSSNSAVMHYEKYGFIYAPGKFCYYDDEGKIQIAMGDYDSGTPYYSYTIDYSEVVYTVDDEGNILIGYRIIPSEMPVSIINLTNAQVNSWYVDINGNQTKFKKVSSLTTIDTAYRYYSFNPPVDFGDIRDQIFFGNKYYTLENNNFILQGIYNNSTTNYYDLTIEPINKAFYEPGVYYTIRNNEYVALDDSSAVILDKVNNHTITVFYKPQQLFVISDSATENPYLPGYKWDAGHEFVPASVTLGVRQETDSLIPIPNINNGESSLNGILLNLNRLYGKNNEYTRDLNSFLGCINVFNDLLASFKEEKDNKMLYVNRFGQIETTNYSYGDFINLMQKVDALGEVSDT